MFQEFKAFIMRGNVLDLAVAVIIGAAFGKIVASLVNDILMPPLGLLLGRVDFTNLFVSLSGTYATLEEAKKAGAPTLNYGVFLNHVVEFVIVAFAVFLLVRLANRLQRTGPSPEPTTKDCPYCISAISIKATRCAFCTTELKATA